MSKKLSFFERLTGSVKIKDDEAKEIPVEHVSSRKSKADLMDETPAEAELTVDVHQTPSEIIVKTMVAGVKPEDLDVAISRDMVTIKGKRESERMISDEDYFHQELYWGAFSRTIVLPQEIDPEGAEAIERHGLLIIKLPKIDKNRQTRLRVKSNNN